MTFYLNLLYSAVLGHIGLKRYPDSKNHISDSTAIVAEKNKYKNGDVHSTLRHKAWSGVKCRPTGFFNIVAGKCT